jgi:hypothetical protein
MTTTTTEKKSPSVTATETRRLVRLLAESYGPGAWHGPDMKAAIADVDDDAAYWRPGPARHNVAEIALHHAFYLHSVRGRLGEKTEPFPVAGEDWFEQSAGSGLGWKKIREYLERQQAALVQTVESLGTGRVRSPLTEAERFDVILGITCHGIYHAGQIQLLKRLREG